MAKARKTQRKTLKAGRKLNKTNNRSERKTNKQNARNVKKNAKISVKQAKKLNKIYGDMTPEQVNQINKVQPYAGAMLDELEAKGIPVNDEDDTVEIASKYAVSNEDIEDPVSVSDIEDAYGDNTDPNVSDFEHAEKSNRSKTIISTGIGAVMGGVNAYMNGLKDKEKQGILTDKEKETLSKVKDAKKNVVRSQLDFNLMDIVPILIIGVLAVIVFKK